MTSSPSASRPPGVSLPSPMVAAGLVLAALAAGLAWAPLFGFADLVLPLGIAILVPTVLAYAAVARDWSIPRLTAWSGSMLVISATYALFAATTTVGLPTITTFTSIGAAAWNGAEQILTSPAPAYPDPTMVFIPFTLLWLVSQAGGRLATAGKPRLALLIILPVWASGIALSAGTLGVNLLATVTLGVAAIILLVVTATPVSGQVAHTTRRLAPAVLLVASLVAVGAVVAASAIQPWDPRTAIAAPITEPDVTDPLTQLRKWQRDPGTVAVKADFEGQPQPLVLVTLDSYNGRTWNASGGYQRAGRIIPPQPDTWPTGEPATATVTVDRLDNSDWVPVVDRPTDISDGHWLVNSDSGMIRRNSDQQFPFSYTVTGSAPHADATTRSAPGDPAMTLDQSVTPVAEPLLPDSTPRSLVDVATAATAGARTPAERAEALADYFRMSFTNDPKVASGSSLGHIRTFIEHRQAADELGFVAAYATLARAVGLPSRIVIALDSSKAAANGMLDGNAGTAITQIWLGEQTGWQTFDAVPEEGKVPDAKPESIPEPEPQEQQAPTIQQAQQCDGCYEETDATVPTWAKVTGLLAMLTILPPLGYAIVVLSVKALRRRRRLTGNPRSSVRGAFAEAVDGYVDAGQLHLTPDLTDTEAARRVQLAGPLVALAERADAAAFSPNEPTPFDVTEAWELADAALSELKAGESRMQQIREKLAARSLLARRIPTRRRSAWQRLFCRVLGRQQPPPNHASASPEHAYEGVRR